jgi:quinol-cytochrome oxidoreductase complex cytochrome b subunit
MLNVIFGPVLDWLDERFKLRPVLDRVLKDPVPERGGWWYTLGAALFLLILVQVVTGIYLMIFYDSAPSGARQSVLYIQNEVFLGWFIRGIHYWNQVILVLVIGVHLTRTFVSAAYKRPRELTWVLGVTLLLLMIATAFTGGILRWDQSGYFDAVVATSMAGWTPFIGPWLAEILRGGSVVGPLTLGRFFPLHVWLLPVALLALATVHILFIILQGQFGSWVNYEPEPADTPPRTPEQMKSHAKLESQILNPKSRKVNLPVRTTWFYPNHIYREAVVAMGLFVVVVVAALFFQIPVEEPVNPATTTYAPSAMWFLLFQDQLLLLFPGPYLIPIVVVVIPTIIILVLFLFPWIDRNRALKPTKRPMAIAFISVIAITVLGMALLAASRVFNYDFINIPR